MNVWIFLIPWILVGLGVVFVAFSGGPGRARQAYLTRGNRAFQITILVIYLGVGIAVPAIILTARTDAQGATSQLETKHASAQISRGKTLCRATCARMCAAAPKPYRPTRSASPASRSAR